jgi:hypothetical protein
MAQITERFTSIVTQLSELEASAVCLAIRTADHVADVEEALEGMTGDLRGVPAPCASDILAKSAYQILERHGAVEKDYDVFLYPDLADAIEDIRRSERRKPVMVAVDGDTAP